MSGGHELSDLKRLDDLVDGLRKESDRHRKNASWFAGAVAVSATVSTVGFLLAFQARTPLESGIGAILGIAGGAVCALGSHATVDQLTQSIQAADTAAIREVQLSMMGFNAPTNSPDH